MHFGIEVVPFGEYADPRKIAELAVAAEAQGWEGLWIWDHVHFEWGCGDPWISLAAAAAATEKLKLIVGVAPLPRYQPHLLARTVTGLDLLSEGRVILGAGLGVDWDLTPYGVPGEAAVRAKMTDEALGLLAEIWTGEKVAHRGPYYQVDGVRLAPTPLQRPRPRVWIGGDSPPALRRAARWDGWIIGTIGEDGSITKSPEDIARQAGEIRAHLLPGQDFDIAVDGISAAGENGLAGAYAAAGATWWFEALYGTRGSHAEMLDRLAAGPPS